MSPKKSGEEGVNAEIPTFDFNQKEEEFFADADQETEELINTEELNETEKEINIGFFFAPGIYRSFKYLGLMKKVERTGIKPQVLSGIEMGAVLALYWGKHGNINLAEWDFFDLIRKLKNEKPNSKEWKDIILEKLKKDFKNLKFESLKIPVVLPVMTPEGASNVASDGFIWPYLDSIFHSKSGKCDSFCSVLNVGNVDLSRLRDKFPGYWVLFDFLAPPTLFYSQGYEIGVYNIASTKLQNNYRFFNFIYRDSSDQNSMDDYSKIKTFQRRGELLANDFLLKYKRVQASWKSKID